MVNKEPVEENRRFLRITVHLCLGITAGDADGYSDSYVRLQFAGWSKPPGKTPNVVPEFDEADFGFQFKRRRNLRLVRKDWAEWK